LGLLGLLLLLLLLLWRWLFTASDDCDGCQGYGSEYGGSHGWGFSGLGCVFATVDDDRLDVALKHLRGRPINAYFLVNFACAAQHRCRSCSCSRHVDRLAVAVSPATLFALVRASVSATSSGSGRVIERDRIGRRGKLQRGG